MYRPSASIKAGGGHDHAAKTVQMEYGKEAMLAAEIEHA
jgi:hypothetical protein